MSSALTVNPQKGLLQDLSLIAVPKSFVESTVRRDGNKQKTVCISTGYGNEPLFWTNTPRGLIDKRRISSEIPEPPVQMYVEPSVLPSKEQIMDDLHQENLRQKMPNLTRSLSSHLPKWMLDRKNREDMLKAIERLEKKVA